MTFQGQQGCCGSNCPNFGQSVPCNNIFPEIIGDGDVIPIVNPDGSIQYFFQPKTKWLNQPFAQSCFGNLGNQSLGIWLIRGIISPEQCQEWKNVQFPLTFGMQYPRPELTFNSAVPFKFHNDGRTSTTDLQYFCGNTAPAYISSSNVLETVQVANNSNPVPMEISTMECNNYLCGLKRDCSRGYNDHGNQFMNRCGDTNIGCGHFCKFGNMNDSSRFGHTNDTNGCFNINDTCRCGDTNCCGQSFKFKNTNCCNQPFKCYNNNDTNCCIPPGMCGITNDMNCSGQPFRCGKMDTNTCDNHGCNHGNMISTCGHQECKCVNTNTCRNQACKRENIHMKCASGNQVCHDDMDSRWYYGTAGCKCSKLDKAMFCGHPEEVSTNHWGHSCKYSSKRKNLTRNPAVCEFDTEDSNKCGDHDNRNSQLQSCMQHVPKRKDEQKRVVIKCPSATSVAGEKQQVAEPAGDSHMSTLMQNKI